MSPKSSPRGGSPRDQLAERVEQRVRAVHRALERRDGAAKPRVKRSGSKRATTPNAGSEGDAASSREQRALRSVFHDLGETHRRHRARTGDPVLTDLKAAAIAFRQQPTMAALVTVAGFLDERDLLDW